MAKITITSPEKSSLPSTSKLTIKKGNRINRLLGITFGLLLIAGFGALSLKASDHDDGEVDTKGRNLNLTDLYVFREKDQNPSVADGNLVFIMNTNPRSLARQQYYFSTRARYEFNVTRAANNNASPTGKPDVVLRFEFGAPNNYNQQQVKVTAIRDGGVYNATGVTTPLNPNPSTQPTINQVSLAGQSFGVFAGLREDPFFFDVEQYFRVRAGARGLGPKAGFRPVNTAIDFAKGYNVNAIAVRVPIKFLQGATSTTTFDVWQTISVPRQGNRFTQVERLARPVINEGLVVPNDFLNALNSVGPDFEAAALAGRQPQANTAAPIVADVIKTLKAVGNNDARANSLVRAFLPDVMRIDTTKRSGYVNAVNNQGSPITGRLLKDDVFDMTINVLTNGAIKGDNVSYDGTPGNPAQGHQPLVSSFPYLALPN